VIIGVDGKIILKREEIWRQGMNCIRVVQNMVQWRAVVNTVMNLRVPYAAGNFSAS